MNKEISTNQLIGILTNPLELVRILSSACKVEEYCIEDMDKVRMPNEGKYVVTIKKTDNSDASIFSIEDQTIIAAKHYNSSK